MSENPYRQPLPATPDPYLAAWADLRRRRRWMRLGFAIVCGAPLFRLVFPPGFRWLGFAAANILGAFVSLAQGGFRCPRCAGQMIGFWTSRAEDWNRCRHCGISVGTPKALAPQIVPLLRAANTAPADARLDDHERPSRTCAAAKTGERECLL